MRLRENRAYPGTGSEGDFSLGTHGGRESHVMGLAASRFPGVVSAVVFAQADVQHPTQPEEGVLQEPRMTQAQTGALAQPTSGF